ncbi:tetratricopeptide repeat protein [Nocardia sp. NPDC058666]|uniref:tetratricopeptide repeat protein n=1 Tax=Nocardia sp. NPDC058666 TaxID=3346587 RepID=UPI0036644967
MSASMVPPWADPFLPRQPVMDDMAAQIELDHHRGKPALLYLHGLEGLGVSCTVTQFWNRYQHLINGPLVWLSGRHPDGNTVPLGELLSRALLKFAVPEADQGTTEFEKADSFQAVASSHKKFLLVVDDIDNIAQILPFIPVDAPDAIIMATSALRSSTLEQRGFAPFTPDLLSAEAAEELFRAGLGDTALSLDDATIDQLTTFCGGIPLLIKVLAAQICGRPPKARILLSQLRKSGVRLLKLDDEQRMQRFLDTAYDNLTDAEKIAYRRLGSLPAAHFGVDAVAAILGIEADAAYELLERLTELSLLTCADPARDRFAFHPVLRDDARARALATDDPNVLRQAVEDWVTWFLREALPRAAVISQRWWVSPVSDLMVALHPDGVPLFTRPAALAWFDAEDANLVAAVRAAHRAELHDLAWPLCVALWKYLHLHGRYEAWIDTHVLGLASAEAANCDLGIMQLSSQLGSAYLELTEYADARECFTRALQLARTTDHLLGEQSALEWLGKIAAAQGQFATALAAYQQSWDVVAASGSRISPAEQARAFAILLLQRARAEYASGNLARAVTDAQQAIDYFVDEPTETDNTAKARLILGRAQSDLGSTDEAIATFTAALRGFEAEDVRKQQAHTRRLLGDAYRAAGSPTEAIDQYRSALDYYRSVGNALADAVARAITELSGTPPTE